MGIDLGGTKIYAVVLNGEGRVVWDRRIATPAGDYAATLDALVALVTQARHDCGPCSIGIGTPGTVMPDGLMKNSNSEYLNGRPLLADLGARLRQPVRMANDANCLALSEASDGAGAGAPVVFAVILGTGTGAGIAVHGRVLTGPNGLAGEWGHIPLPWAVPGSDPALRCYCGQSGCIETVLSGPGMARDHLAHCGATLSAEQIAVAALHGDAACTATLQRYCHRLARALAGIINVLDPDVIVLAGGLSHIAALYEQVPRLWGAWVVSAGLRDTVRTRLVASAHGDASGVRGAAWLGRDAAVLTSAETGAGSCG
jgi:fructokinase